MAEIGELASRMTVLSPAECAQVHEAATHLLSAIGLRVEHERVLDMAAECGFRVDRAAMRVRWERDEVDAALHERTGRGPGSDAPPLVPAPGAFTLRSGIRKYLWHAGRAQPAIPTRRDLRDLVVLSDALPSVTSCCLTSVGARDVPTATAEIHAWAIGLKHLTPGKVSGYVLDVRSVPYLCDLWTIFRGSDAALRAQPVISYGCFISTPLTLSRQALDILFALHDRALPVSISGTMPIVGASAPMSLCGTLALGMAEGLGGMLLSSLFGVAGLPATAPVTMDPRSGSPCYGAVESMIMAVAQQDLLRWYGFTEPVVSWITNEADEPNSHGFVAGMQRGLSLLFGLLGGIRGAYGGLASSDVSSLPLLVLDDEFAGLANRLLRGMEVSGDLLATSLTERLAQGGSFLKDDEALDFAMRHMRGELFLPALLDRRSVAAWLDHPDDAFARAEAKVGEILAAHDPHPLTEDQEQAIDAVVARADRALAG